jgi:hypothetical protein
VGVLGLGMEESLRTYVRFFCSWLARTRRSELAVDRLCAVFKPGREGRDDSTAVGGPRWQVGAHTIRRAVGARLRTIAIFALTHQPILPLSLVALGRRWSGFRVAVSPPRLASG